MLFRSKPEHVPAWKRIVDFVHERTQSKIGVQLAHAGRKGSCCTPWEGHAQLPPDRAWTTLAPSPIPFDADRVAPRAMDRADMVRVRDAFANGEAFFMLTDFNTMLSRKYQ